MQAKLRITIALLAVWLLTSAFDNQTTKVFQDITKVFDGERFPGLLVIGDNKLLAVWGKENLKLAISEDEGKTFVAHGQVPESGINGGGALYLPKKNRIILFSQIGHPFSPMKIHHSDDNGNTWTTNAFKLDGKTQLHFAGSGRVLKSKKCRDVLIRPTRVYGKVDGYNNAIYSTNYGDTWEISGPFPKNGTGEGSIIEKENGDLLYFSRVHYFPSEYDVTSGKWVALSDDCGRTWHNPKEIAYLPDGPRYRNLYEGHGPSHQGHFGLISGLAKFENTSTVLYTNVDSKNGLRKGLTIWVSYDDGVTWPLKRKIWDGPSAYSSVVTLNDKVTILFEGGRAKEYEGGFYINFTLDDLKNEK